MTPLRRGWRLSVFLVLTGFPQRGWPLVGENAAHFLGVPVGGRPAALADAYSSLAVDAYAPVLNPSGLGFLTQSQLALMHLSYLDSTAHEFGSLVFPLASGRSMGVSAQLFRPGDTPSRDVFGNDRDDFSGSFAAYTFAYGQAFSSMFSMGLSGTYIDAKIAEITANAYALGIGMLFQVTDKIRVSATGANLGSKLKFQDTGDSLPATGRLGMSVHAGKEWLFAFQGTYSEDDELTGQSGIEWVPQKIIAFRVGYRSETLRESTALAGLTTGVGIDLANQHFDYAWVPLGDLGDTHYFSLLFQWGIPESAPFQLEDSEGDYPEQRTLPELRRGRIQP